MDRLGGDTDLTDVGGTFRASVSTSRDRGRGTFHTHQTNALLCESRIRPASFLESRLN